MRLTPPLAGQGSFYKIDETLTSLGEVQNSRLDEREDMKKNMPLFERVYAVVRQIPFGKVSTYGDVAREVGTRDARKVGWALHQNPHPPLREALGGGGEAEVPCHRVVNKAGRLAPNFAFDGPEEQRRRLEGEGVVVGEDGCVELGVYGWHFDE